MTYVAKIAAIIGAVLVGFSSTIAIYFQMEAEIAGSGVGAAVGWCILWFVLALCVIESRE